MDEQSQAAFDLSAYNADTSQHGYTEAVAAYLKTDSKPDHSIASMSASHWFLHQSMRLRFVGMTREQCLEMREALIEVAAQHANSPTRVLAAALSKEAERHYPQEFATEWVKEHPTARRPAA